MHRQYKKWVLGLVVTFGLVALGGMNASAAQTAPYTIYNDQLASGWSNWSWGSKVDVASTDETADGNQAIKWTPAIGWSGLYLRADTRLAVSDYDYLQLSMRATNTAHRLYTYTSTESANPSVALDNYKTGTVSGWNNYSVPLDDIMNGQTSLEGLVIQDTSGKVSGNIYVDAVKLTSAAVADEVNANQYLFSAGLLAAGSGRIYTESSATTGKGLLIWSNAAVELPVNIPASSSLTIRARADLCNGSPLVLVKVDGKDAAIHQISSSHWQDYKTTIMLPAGQHTVAVQYTNDYFNGCDRNVRLDSLSFTTTPIAAPAQPPTASTKEVPVSEIATNPLAGKQLYVNPNSAAAKQQSAWKISRPNDAARIAVLANQSTGQWFGDWTKDVKASVDAALTQAGTAVPTLVTYDIPNRDCGSYSAGGAGSADAYKQWIDQFAAGLNNRAAIVILEPDALSLDDCLSAAQQSERHDLLRYATQTLSSNGGIVYIDAGHANWRDTKVMAKRLSQAGISEAAGFSLNVSNFNPTDQEITYGNKISSIVDKHFVIDTSRNGNGSASTFCNPSGRSIGNLPTVSTGYASVDAFLWVKVPGESDGSCNGGPNAGVWWPDYALGLLNLRR